MRHHHERWDGAGYPDGPAGEAIPDGARILALADAWDAMTTDRPYRPALPAGAALGEVQRLSGVQFMPGADGLLRDALPVVGRRGLSVAVLDSVRPRWATSSTAN